MYERTSLVANGVDLTGSLLVGQAGSGRRLSGQAQTADCKAPPAGRPPSCTAAQRPAQPAAQLHSGTLSQLHSGPLSQRDGPEQQVCAARLTGHCSPVRWAENSTGIRPKPGSRSEFSGIYKSAKQALQNSNCALHGTAPRRTAPSRPAATCSAQYLPHVRV